MVPVQEYLHFALAPPTIQICFLIGLNSESCSKVAALTRDAGKNLEILLQFRWVFAAVMGMKVKIAGVMPATQGVVNVIKQKLEVPAAFICKHDFHARSERHRYVAIETLTLRTWE